MTPGSIVVVDGDFESDGNSAGLLVVTGHVTWHGNDEWNGIVLVIGAGSMLRAGGGNGDPSGAVVVADIDPTPDGPRADKSDWCTGGGPDGFGAADYEVQGGGNSDVYYCSTDIENANPLKTYRVVDFLQR
jgi:hypothetical protein